MWSLLREISFRHFKHSPLRTALVILGIALGVSMLSAVLSTNRSLLRAFEDMVDRVAGKADLTVAAGSGGISNTLTGEIADLEGVEHAASMLEVTTRTTDENASPLLVLGVDFLGDTFFLPFAQKDGEDEGVVADPLAFVNDPTAVLVAKKLATQRNLQVGSPLPLLTPDGEKTFYVRGMLEDEGPAASFGGQVVVMFLDALQVSFGRGELVDRIDVVIADGEDTSVVQERIRGIVKGSAQVEPPSGRAARLVTALWAFRNGLNVSGLAALWVGMFLIYNAVSVSVAQRRREVGILRALGVTRRGVTLLFCLEALVMALLASVIGLLLGGELAKAALANAAESLQGFALPMTPPPPQITLDIALMSVATALLSTVFAAYFPARKSSHIDPAEALRATRSSATLGTLPQNKLAVLGAIIVALSCIPAYFGGELNGYLASSTLVMGLALFVPVCVRGLRLLVVGTTERALGIPGRLALDNVERSLGRSSITVIAMMLAIAMSMTIGTYGHSFERSLVAWVDEAFFGDAVITAGSPANEKRHVPFSDDVAARIAGVEGLDHASPFRHATYDLHGKAFQINAKSVVSAVDELKRNGGKLHVIDGPSTIDPQAMVDAPRVTLSENLANALHLSAGDQVTLDTPTGARSVEIYAVLVDYSSDKGTMFMDLKWYREFFRDDKVDVLELYFKPGADTEQVAERIRAQLGTEDLLFVTPQEALREDLKKVGANLTALSRAPELVTLVVAFMGVVGTMLAAVIDRIREIGVLRAIGASRRQIIGSVVAEASFLGLAGTLCGVAAGIPEGFLFLKVIGVATSGWNLPYAFPVETALRVGVVIVAAAGLAGLLPGVRASRLDVRDALSYD